MVINIESGRVHNERELNNWCGVSSICNSLHLELHLFCSIVCCTLPCHASFNRTCIIYLFLHHAMSMWWLFTMLFVSFRVASLVSFGFVPELWGFVRLRLFVFFMDSIFFLAGSQARWPYPRNHLYLCFASCSLYCHAPLPITCYIMSPFCHVSP